MTWTNEDTEALQQFTLAIDSDDIKVKEQIKKKLLNNRFIIHVLNNKELEEKNSEPDDYYGINILPYYMIPDTQTETKNFLCYEVSYKDLSRGNNIVKLLQIVFHILCHQEDIIESTTNIARHDLLAALVQDQFNFTTYCGAKMELISDTPGTTDNDYASRTLTFQQITDNNIVKTINGVPWIINKHVQPHA